MINPTEEQQAIIEAVASGKTLKVAALAGTGKTSTLVMIAKAYPKRKGLYLAYNKALQLEAKQKFPPWIECKTMHGLAYPQTGFMFKDQLTSRIDYEKAINHLEISGFYADVPLGKGEIASIGMTSAHILSLIRSIVRHFQYQAEEEITLESFESFIVYEVKQRHPELSMTAEDNDEKKETIKNFYKSLNSMLLAYSQRLWRLQKSPQSRLVPADHDTYLKLYQLKKPMIEAYDYIMLDESQDANGCLLDILANQKCQIIYVGDQYQQIYGYRGTVNAMRKVEGETLYLTQSFRFGEAIANQCHSDKIITVL